MEMLIGKGFKPRGYTGSKMSQNVELLIGKGFKPRGYTGSKNEAKCEKKIEGFM